MDKKDLRIVFMGTPEFAVASLDRLIINGFNVVAVVTMPDKPIGRHQTQLSSSAIKKYALEHDLPILQPEKLKDDTFLEQLRSFQADLQIVVAFRMLPEVVWNMPRFGTFNLHAALLPQYRGAAPINWAVINGDTETGVTTFFLDHDIDTGRIIRQEKCPIADTDSAGDVHDKLMEIGASLVVDTVNDILSEKVPTIPQSELIADASHLRHAPKIFRETCQIDWQKTIVETYNFIRGLSPYPAAWTNMQTEKSSTIIKIFETEKVFVQPIEPIGTLVVNNGKDLLVAMRNGYLRILSLQAAGKKRMTTREFLNGFRPDGPVIFQ